MTIPQMPVEGNRLQTVFKPSQSTSITMTHTKVFDQLKIAFSDTLPYSTLLSSLEKCRKQRKSLFLMLGGQNSLYACSLPIKSFGGASIQNIGRASAVLREKERLQTPRLWTTDNIEIQCCVHCIDLRSIPS
uniref:Putative aminotransferase n=1 Tax=Ixodes ricinus TaxID=34613 RepID=A0A0K8RHT7_IXORI